MASLHARYPEDVEAAVFYALALNEAEEPSDKTFAKQLKAAELLERLEPKYPNHRGIPHYIIHSYDYPELGAAPGRRPPRWRSRARHLPKRKPSLGSAGRLAPHGPAMFTASPRPLNS